MSAITATVERYEEGDIEWEQVLAELEDFNPKKPKMADSGFDTQGHVWPQDGTVQEVEALRIRGSLTEAEALELVAWLAEVD